MNRNHIKFQFLSLLRQYNIKRIFNRYDWITNSAYFDVLEDGFQTLSILKSGTYKFELIAPGWYQECSGVRVCGSVTLKKGRGQTLRCNIQKKNIAVVSGRKKSYRYIPKWFRMRKMIKFFNYYKNISRFRADN